jgi:hypothetical protein
MVRLCFTLKKFLDWLEWRGVTPKECLTVTLAMSILLLFILFGITSLIIS